MGVHVSDYVWVDHRVDQNSALTCAIKSGILCIASVTCWTGAYVRIHTPPPGTTFSLIKQLFTIASHLNVISYDSTDSGVFVKLRVTEV